MKLQKSLILAFLLVGLFSFTSLSAIIPIETTKTSLSKVFQKHLKTLDLDEFGIEDETVYVDFMVNERAEIIVLSTSNKELDATIKAKLNYKTVDSGDMEYFKKYTVPVKFKK